MGPVSCRGVTAKLRATSHSKSPAPALYPETPPQAPFIIGGDSSAVMMVRGMTALHGVRESRCAADGGGLGITMSKPRSFSLNSAPPNGVVATMRNELDPIRGTTGRWF